ncbi:SDR family NAD(P)-dependent oxidoreductase [Paenibacillus sp. 1001270B_150601_E10]|uniref:SDR family NAD(P)-dependent oxidoreductase n=1 Tax=Paenibacillus sp. 1001270B_150601_E10 TaxID=2787079 RepID=UPI00189DDF00|nr:SDR family NAD(P)-dependent oxidoreductase [Paenibacillus sp. 1001270B_150601_E10]
MSLRNKVVWITGASSGIGALTAKYISEAGGIPILAARSEAKLREAAQGITGPHECVVLDVTDNEQIHMVLEGILERHGRVDVLINNAGFGLFKTAMDLTLQEFEEMMDVNYMGVVRCTKAVLPSMLARGEGHIVNIASIAGKIGTPKSTAYSASKHAVLGFTNSLRMELAQSGVTISAINPGPIDTPFFDKADPSGQYVNNVRWFIMPPERVAKKIVSVIEKGRTEADLPGLASFGVKLMQLFPRLSSGVAAKVLNKK